MFRYMYLVNVNDLVYMYMYSENYKCGIQSVLKYADFFNVTFVAWGMGCFSKSGALVGRRVQSK